MQDVVEKPTIRGNRRVFLKHGGLAAGGAAIGLGLLAKGSSALADQGGGVTRGDIAILTFLAAVETIETDLWLQYAELGGVQDNEIPGLPTGGSAAYTAALNNLDADMAQYIHDNTDDEFSHRDFLNAYLASKGADPVNLDRFRTLPSSRATGANQIGRLTNLMQLTVDTSWYTRYRSSAKNPDLNPGFKFPQAVPSLSSGQFPAIPTTDDDLRPTGHIQAIANTAAFHFCFIEQGGSSLYPILALKVSNLEVLRILLSIGPTETSHFQTWHDKAGNAISDPLAPLTDPNNPQLVFPNLNVAPFGGEDFQTNLIMPEPCPFLSRKFPAVSIIRPTSDEQGGAVATVNAFTKDGLFIGQSKEFFELLADLAHDADSASRGS
jgi:Ferritin-like domain